MATEIKSPSTGADNVQDLWNEEATFFNIPNEKALTFGEEENNFALPEDEDNLPPVDLSKDEKKKKDLSKPKEGEEEEKEEPKFFEETPETEEDEDEDEEDSEEEVDKDTKFYTTLANEMKEKGIFSGDIPEKVDEEGFFELQEKENETKINEVFEQFFEDLDDDAVAFLKHKKAGGRTKDFFNVYGSLSTFEGVDLEDEKNQDKVLSYYMRTVEQMDEDEIEDRIEWLKTNNKKKATAEKYSTKLIENDAKSKAALAESLERQAEERERNSNKFNTELEDTLTKTEKVKNFTFTKDDKKDLFKFVTKPTVKVGKNTYITEFQHELSKLFKAEGEEGKQNLLLLAKLVKTGFDVKDVITAAKTKTVQETRKKLETAKSGPKPASSGSYTKKQLSDYF